MRERGDILLVSCYELGHQPMGLASPLAFLRAAGFDPAVADTHLAPLESAAVERARMVAIAVPMHTALRLGLQVARRLRARNPGVHICFHGLYAALNRQLLLAGDADSVVGAEGEARLVEVARSLERGEAPAADRPAPVGHLELPVPARTGLAPLARYAALIDGDGSERVAGYVEATRGCKHRCRHCPIVPVYDGRFFAVPVATVLADARQQVTAGARHLSFGDPDFLNGPTHAMRVARGLAEECPGVSFDVTIKVEHLLAHPDLVAELPGLGCAFVVTAAESLSDAVLERLRKGHVRADLDRLIDLADSVGLALRPTFVPFTPWSDLDDYLELLDWLEARDLVGSVDPVQLAIRLLVPPGSALLELPAEPGWPGPLDRERLTHTWRHRDPRVDELQARVAARVERASREHEDGAVTFAAIRELAGSYASPTPRPRRPLRGPRRDQPPRLAEHWFC